jgi:prevent-host-death family protein
MKLVRTWQFQIARAKLSELLRCASDEGPQEITVRGKGAFVVLTREEFERQKLLLQLDDIDSRIGEAGCRALDWRPVST